MGRGLATVSCGGVSCEAIDQHFQLIFAPIIRQHYVASKGERERQGERERGSVREFVVPCKCATCPTSFALAAQTFAEASYKVCYVSPPLPQPPCLINLIPTVPPYGTWGPPQRTVELFDAQLLAKAATARRHRKYDPLYPYNPAPRSSPPPSAHIAFPGSALQNIAA